MVGGSGTVMSAVSGVNTTSGGSSGRTAPIALVSNVNDSQSRLSLTQVNNRRQAIPIHINIFIVNSHG